MKHNKPLRVWWIPQVPMDPFYVVVYSLFEGKKILEVLADYDRFQFENKVKPDYSNAGGLQEKVTDNGNDDDWEDYEDEEGRNIDDIEIEELMEKHYEL